MGRPPLPDPSLPMRRSLRRPAAAWLTRTAHALLVASLAIAPALAGGEDERPWIGEDPVTDALDALGEEVRTFHAHVTFLASPFLEGRLPGTRGMEIARDYCEHHLRAAGLEPAFPDEDAGVLGFRQPFELRGRSELESQQLAAPGRDLALTAGEDYQALSLGSGGSASGPAVFVGYSIRRGPREIDYATFPEDADLTGKVAVMFRFEPMDADGNSLWLDGGRGPWSARAGLGSKVRAATRLGASAVLIINPPGANDPRAGELSEFSAGGAVGDVPVFHMTVEAATRLLDGTGHDLMGLREMADQATPMLELGFDLALEAAVERVPQLAANVGGLLPGRGALADQLVVVGAHLDHLGMGDFGSRDRDAAGKELHPGADDNASGSAGVLMLAERLAAEYAALPADADARSLLFILFDAEESGLNGANHYVENPIRALADHSLMMNYDMIGRLEDGRISVSGHDTGEGLAELVLPLFEASPLTVLPNQRGGGGSDHMAFEAREVPVLFGIIARDTFHDDYHTPRDTVEKINRVGAVQAIDLWHSILSAVAVHPERIAFKTPSEEPAQELTQAPRRGVRFGISPGYEENAPGEIGVLVERVSSGGAAELAGVEAGDRLIRWDGVKISDLGDWMSKLAEHEPGDEVAVGVERGGEEVTLQVILQAAQ
jgi:hypothetical protein